MVGRSRSSSVENEPPSNGQPQSKRALQTDRSSLIGGRPQSKRAHTDSSEEDEVDLNEKEKGKKNGRSRKRLSIKRNGLDISRGSTVSVPGSTIEKPKDPAELRNIYATCINLFQSHKINQENAFQLRFLDLMGEIIDMPDFDKNDMHGAGRALETGAKIYVCRVDKTKHSVMDLASTLNLQSRKKKNVNEDNNGDNDEGHDGDFGAADGDEEQNKQKKKKKRKMKSSRFIVDNESKISVILEDDTATPAMRRDTLKLKFNTVGDEDKDFDYDCFFFENQNDNPLNQAGVETFNNVAVISEAMIHRAEAQTVEFLPFVQVAEFRCKDMDVWGNPINVNDFEKEAHRDEELIFPSEIDDDAPAIENASYKPDDRPLDYGPDDLEDHNMGNDTFVNEDEIEVNAEGVPVINLKKFTTLKDFFAMYSIIKSKYGWCGPAFVRPQFFLNRNGLANLRKPRIKKDPIKVDYKGINWNLRENKYDVGNPEKTVFDERTIEKWSSGGRRIPPYLGIEDIESDDFDSLNYLTCKNEQEEIPEMFRYFLDRNRNILGDIQGGPMKEEDEGYPDQFIRDEEDYIEEAGFEIERHRDIDESGPGMDGDAQLDVEIFGPPEASFTFPVSLGGLLMDTDGDPISKASEGDSLKFTRKPKPIDMHALKRSILKFLKEKLLLQDNGAPSEDDETSTDLISLVKEICITVDKKMVEHLSIAIIVVGLMHVVVDKKLFMEVNPTEPSNPRIICRGKLWKHQEHIPLPDPDNENDLL